MMNNDELNQHETSLIFANNKDNEKLNLLYIEGIEKCDENLDIINKTIVLCSFFLGIAAIYVIVMFVSGATFDYSQLSIPFGAMALLIILINAIRQRANIKINMEHLRKMLESNAKILENEIEIEKGKGK